MLRVLYIRARSKTNSNTQVSYYSNLTVLGNFTAVLLYRRLVKAFRNLELTCAGSCLSPSQVPTLSKRSM